MRNLSTLTLCAILSACTVFGGGSAPEQSDFDRALSRWESLDWSDYTLRVFRGCFCIGAGEYEVWVRNDHVVAVRPAGDNQSDVLPQWWDAFPTVDELFEIAERALREAGSVEVTYSEFGWPKLVDIDWITEAIDDEIVYRVTEVTEAPAGDVIELGPGASATSHGLTVRFDGITSDSRCALDVQCIWAGEATAALTITGTDTQSVELSDGATSNGPTRHVDIGPVRIVLLAVIPYPERAAEPVEPGDYRVRLLVENI